MNPYARNFHQIDGGMGNERGGEGGGGLVRAENLAHLDRETIRIDNR